MIETRNDKAVNVKVSRFELCDIMLALTLVNDSLEKGDTRFKVLHDKLKIQLNKWDEEYDNKHKRGM